MENLTPIKRVPDAVHTITIVVPIIDGKPSLDVKCVIQTNKSTEGILLAKPMIEEMTLAQLLVHLAEVQKSIGVQLATELEELRQSVPALLCPP